MDQTLEVVLYECMHTRLFIHFGTFFTVILSAVNIIETSIPCQ